MGLACVFLIINYTNEMEEELTKKWLWSSAVSIAISTFVTAPLKVRPSSNVDLAIVGCMV